MIARIDPYDYQRQYQTALANYKTTESIYERNQRLYAANAVAKQNLEIAQTDYIQATSALNMARRTLDYTVLTAPFDGLSNTLRRESRRNTYRAIGRPSDRS